MLEVFRPERLRYQMPPTWRVDRIKERLTFWLASGIPHFSQRCLNNCVTKYSQSIVFVQSQELSLPEYCMTRRLDRFQTIDLVSELISNSCSDDINFVGRWIHVASWYACSDYRQMLITERWDWEEEIFGYRRLEFDSIDEETAGWDHSAHCNLIAESLPLWIDEISMRRWKNGKIFGTDITNQPKFHEQVWTVQDLLQPWGLPTENRRTFSRCFCGQLLRQTALLNIESHISLVPATTGRTWPGKLMRWAHETYRPVSLLRSGALEQTVPSPE